MNIDNYNNYKLFDIEFDISSSIIYFRQHKIYLTHSSSNFDKQLTEKTGVGQYGFMMILNEGVCVFLTIVL